MDKNSLAKKVKKLGYPLFEIEEPIDANLILAEVVKCRQTI